MNCCFQYSIKAILTLSLFLLSATAHSDDLNLSLEQAIEMTKASNEEMRLRLVAIEKNENLYREAIASILPQLSAEATWQKFFQNPVFFTSTFPIDQQLQSSVTLTQTLWAFGRVTGAIKAARINKTIGSLEKQLTENEMAYITEQAYYGFLLAESQVKVAKQALQNAEENLKILERKFSGGRPPQGDYLRLKSDISSRVPQLKVAETNYEHAQMTLAQLIGREDQRLHLTTPFKKTFASYSQEQLIKEMEKSHPQLAILQHSIEFADHVAKVQNASNLPVLSAFGSYSYSGGSTGALTADNLNGYSFGGLSLKWNIWEGGGGRARYRQAVNDKSAAEIKLIQSKKSLRLNLKKSIASYNNLVTSYQSARDAVDLAEKSFKISQRRFSTGQSSVTEVNSSEFALTQARIGLTTNIYQIHAAIAEINKLIATGAEEKPL